MESTFIEMSNPKESNVIIGYIYRHPNADLNEFNRDYLNHLLTKVSKEKKTVFLFGDYNADLSKYERHSPTNEFLDFLASSMFFPYIIQPARVTSDSKTIIDNIFSNITSADVIQQLYLIIFLYFSLHQRNLGILPVTNLIIFSMIGATLIKRISR